MIEDYVAANKKRHRAVASSSSSSSSSSSASLSSLLLNSSSNTSNHSSGTMARSNDMMKKYDSHDSTCSVGTAVNVMVKMRSSDSSKGNKKAKKMMNNSPVDDTNNIDDPNDVDDPSDVDDPNDNDNDDDNDNDNYDYNPAMTSSDSMIDHSASQSFITTSTEALPSTTLMRIESFTRNKSSVKRRGRIGLQSCEVESIPVKGISKTQFGIYRIQLNQAKNSRLGTRFSKNERNFVTALWIYECAILLSDRPTDLSILLNSGNYEKMVSINLVTSHKEYHEELGDMIQRFKSKHSFFTEEQFEIISSVYQSIKIVEQHFLLARQ